MTLDSFLCERICHTWTPQNGRSLSACGVSFQATNHTRDSSQARPRAGSLIQWSLRLPSQGVFQMLVGRLESAFKIFRLNVIRFCYINLCYFYLVDTFTGAICQVIYRTCIQIYSNTNTYTHIRINIQHSHYFSLLAVKWLVKNHNYGHRRVGEGWISWIPRFNHGPRVWQDQQ